LAFFSCYFMLVSCHFFIKTRPFSHKTRVILNETRVFFDETFWSKMVDSQDFLAFFVKFCLTF